MKKIISALLTLSLALSLVACGGNTSTNVGGDNSYLYHTTSSAPYITLDPSIEYSNGIKVLQNVYETLTRYNSETSEVEPLLATSWENEDGLVWVFNLRDDVVFHDGTHLTSKQVVNSISRTMDLAQGAAYIWDSVVSVEATGEYEITFTCSYPSPIDLLCSSGYAAYIMSDSVIEKDVSWFNQGNDGGTGPYTITQATGDSVVLSAFEDYRNGWSENQYQTVFIREVAESSARRQMLETGESQLSSQLSPTDLNALTTNNDLTVYNAQTFNNVILFLNSQVEPTDNADFRRALAYAFPYEEMVDGILEGNATQSIGTVPEGLWGHNEDGFQYSCDLEKAKEYLTLSGVDTTGLTLTVSYISAYTEYSSALQIYQTNLKQLGINLELKGMEWEQQWAYAQNTNPEDRQDMFLFIWWPDFASPASWFECLAYTETDIVYNLGYTSDSKLDEIIDEARELSVKDRELAQELYFQAQDIIAENAYYLNLYDQVHTYVISNTISGVKEDPAYSQAILYYNVTEN